MADRELKHGWACAYHLESRLATVKQGGATVGA